MSDTATIVLLSLCGLVMAGGWWITWQGGADRRRMDAIVGISPADRKKLDRQHEADEKEAARARIVCQFCHTPGHVHVTHVQRKQGVSGGKATAGLLTGGASLVLVGLSKKGWVNHLTCRNCNMEWDVS